MKLISLLLQIAATIVAVSCQAYGPAGYGGSYLGSVSQQQSNAEASANAYASSQNLQNQIAGAPIAAISPARPCALSVPDRSRTIHATESFHSNKGEILIHRPAPIIVKRPPTRVVVNHPPLVVKPAPVVLHKPPPVVLRKVFVKQHPRPVKVEPVYVNVVKPPAEKYYVNENACRPIARPYPHSAGSAASAASAAGAASS